MEVRNNTPKEKKVLTFSPNLPRTTRRPKTGEPAPERVVTQEMIVELDILRVRASARRRDYEEKRREIERMIELGAEVAKGPARIRFGNRRTMRIEYD